MNILIGADTSVKEIKGGAERVLREQIVALLKRGHTVNFVCRTSERECPEVELNGMIEHSYFVDDNNPLSFFLNSIFRCWRLSKRLKKKLNPEYLYMHQPFTALGMLLAFGGAKVVRIYHCDSLAFEEYKMRNEKPEAVLPKILYVCIYSSIRVIECWCMKWCDAVIVASEFMRDRLKEKCRIPSPKVFINPLGVDSTKFSPSADRQRVRGRYNFPQDRIVLLTVRNLVLRMGLENLVEAVHTVKKMVPEVYLIIGGVGPLREQLDDLVKKLEVENYVRFEGYIPESDLPFYYQAADYFVLPTRCLEGFGLVTLEALACGTPVLGTPTGGTREILGDFPYPLLFKGNKASDIAEGIVEWCLFFRNHKGRYLNIREECRRFVENKYSWENNIGELERLFMQKGENVTAMKSSPEVGGSYSKINR